MRILSASIMLFLLLNSINSNAQDMPVQNQERVFSFTEYMAMVKRHHPVVAQANLIISEAEAELLRARGAFDPKLSGSLSEKQYQNTEYYEIWNGTFTIPTWFGIDLKAGYEHTAGEYLNPQNNTPEEGLWNAGVSMSLLEIFNRRNTLRQARILRNQNVQERNIAVNKILSEAARAYADWMLYYQNKEVYIEFLENAQIRFDGIVSSSILGETPIIDTVETKIAVEQRFLELQGSLLNLQQARLNVSSYLWTDNVPLQLNENLVPKMWPEEALVTLGIEQVLGNAESLEDHPELQVIDFQRQQFDLDIRLRSNELLPDLKVSYNFINETIDDNVNWNTNNYKAGVSIDFPIFLRSARGALKQAQIRRTDAELRLAERYWDLTNEIRAAEQAVLSYDDQARTAGRLVENNEIMVRGEQRLFDLGESSIFLLNTRENRLIDARLKENDIYNKYNEAIIKLFERLRIVWD